MNNSILPTYHNIVSSVRTPKVAILIHIEDKYWKDTLLRVIEWCTKVWGGAYNIIIPTDGKTIDERFWTILEKYSPDYIFSYNYTIADLKKADPQKFNKIIESEEQRLIGQFPTLGKEQLDDFIDREVEMSERLPSDVTAELVKELKQRLSPFSFRDHVVEEKISIKGYVPFPLTDITKIIKNTDIDRVVASDYVKDKDTSLMIYSVFGKLTEEHEVELKKNSIIVDHTSPKISVHNLLEIAIKKEVDLKDYKFRMELRKSLRTRGKKPEYPKEDFSQITPFAISMLKLGTYTLRVDPTRLREDKAVLVIGDTLSDFCLYYSLSRVKKNAYWLPKRYIDSASAAIGNKRSNKLFASIASTACRAIYSKINFGIDGGEIHLLSQSLEKQVLESLKPILVKLMLVDEPRAEKAIVICESEKEHLEELLHIIEENNYANQHTEIFLAGKSVGFIPTPKPKNFKVVDPSVHRWITEITVEGYIPPSLHFLGEKTILTGIDSYPTRVSKYGLAYVSPSWAYFGGDADTNTIRPKLTLLEPLEILREYFSEAGYEDIRISPNGGYSSISIEKFGSLDIIGNFFAQEKNRKLMKKFLVHPSSNTPEQGEVVYIETIKRTFLDFKAVATALGNEEEAKILIDDFIEKKIFYRGLILQCIECRNSDWYALGEIKGEFKCKRCNLMQVIKQKNWKEGNEPKWYYKLDEVVYQGFDNHMYVPLLTLYFLKKTSHDSFLFIPEIELRKKADQKRCDIEIDICCIVDGEIVLGEAKKASIDPDEVTKYEQFANQLMPAPNNVVFSSFEDDWSQELKDSIKKKFKQVMFLFKSELTAT